MSNDKPVRLRYFDSSTKSKAIVDVKWSMLRGNKEPYLSVSIVDVKVNGATVRDYSEQVAALKALDRDLYALTTYHLSRPDGSGKLSNSEYYLKLTIDHHFNPPITKEDIQQQKDALFLKVENNPVVLKYIDLHVTATTIKDLLTDLKNLKDDFTKTGRLLYSCKGLANTENNFFTRRLLEKELEQLGKDIKAYKEFNRRNQFKTFISSSDIWTIERLSGYTGLGIPAIKNVILSRDRKETLKDYLQPTIESNKLEITELSNKYNIPTIKG